MGRLVGIMIVLVLCRIVMVWFSVGLMLGCFFSLVYSMLMCVLCRLFGFSCEV